MARARPWSWLRWAQQRWKSPFDDRRTGRDYWRAVRLNAAMAASDDSAILDQQNVDWPAFQWAAKRHRAELSRPTHDWRNGWSGLRLPADYDSHGHMARIKAIRASAQTSIRADRFISDRTPANLLKQVRGDLPLICPALG